MFESAFDKQLLEMIRDTPAPGKFCAGNAVAHLRKAKVIESVDPAMAIFRAITAEEEAASAVMHAVRRRGYPGFRQLNPRSHLQKNALVPFCYAVSKIVALANEQFALQLHVNIDRVEGNRRVFPIMNGERLGMGERGFTPWPPLNFSILQQPGSPEDFDRTLAFPMGFDRHLAEIASEAGAKDILVHVKQRANERNKLLYASEQGMPEVTLHTFLDLQAGRVRLLILLFLMIDPFAEHQLFVAQCLTAFLAMLRQVPRDAAEESA